MKGKGVTYALIAGVLLIWGIVFYRIFSGLESDSDFQAASIATKPIVMEEGEEKDSVVVLINHYRDPFLASAVRAVSSSPYSLSGGSTLSNKANRPKKEVVKKAPTDWSFIDYIGIINNKETKKKVGLIIISGTEYMVNEKDQIGEVTIVKKERDSVLVFYRNEKKWIKR